MKILSLTSTSGHKGQSSEERAQYRRADLELTRVTIFEDKGQERLRPVRVCNVVGFLASSTADGSRDTNDVFDTVQPEQSGAVHLQAESQL